MAEDGEQRGRQKENRVRGRPWGPGGRCRPQDKAGALLGVSGKHWRLPGLM